MSKIETNTVEYYSQCKERPYHHPVIQAFCKPKTEWILSKINLKNQKVLEVGAGNGYFSNQLMKVCDLSVLDISKHQLKFNPAKKKYQGSAYELPFPDNSFDITFCSNLLHHLDKPQKVLKEMARVAKSHVIISEPNRTNPLLFVGALLKKTERNAAKYSKNFLTKLIKKARLEIEHHTFIGGLVMPNTTPTSLLSIACPKSRSRFSFFQIFICRKK